MNKNMDLREALAAIDVPLAALRMAVLRRYRDGTLSSGRAAEILGVSRIEFLEFCGLWGVSTFQVDDDEAAEALLGYPVKNTDDLPLGELELGGPLLDDEAAQGGE